MISRSVVVKWPPSRGIHDRSRTRIHRPAGAGVTVTEPLQDSLCIKCELFSSCNTVCIPGEGNLDSELLVLGVSPSGVEDKANRPYVGEGGRLLRAILLENGFATKDENEHGLLHNPTCRISYITRCRSPENRDPTAKEVEACSIYLKSEMDSMPNLKYVVTLGALPMKAMGVHGSIFDLAGVPRQAGNLVVIPVFHPLFVIKKQTYLSTWEAHWHQIRATIRPNEQSFASKVGAKIYPNGLENKDWRTL